MRHVFWVCSLLACLFAFAGCAKPYETPQLVNPLKFDGIASLAKKGDVRVVWLHGMCSPGNDWVARRHAALQQAIAPRESLRNIDRSGGGIVEIFHDRADFEVETRYLIWSPLSTSFKDQLRIDEPPGGPLIRAALNRRLKDSFINDCVADAFVYTGAGRQVIGQWVKAQLCDAFGGNGDTGRCVLPRQSDRRAVVLVAESLGSKILSDALFEIRNDSEASGRNAVFEQRISDIQLLFLVSNQLPLLELGDAKGRSAADLEIFDILRTARGTQKRRGSALAPLHIVDFSDPNDALSYPLYSHPGIPSDFAVTSVLVSNAATYFGILENPIEAHCGYLSNPTVLGLIMQGYDGTTLPRISMKSSAPCFALSANDQQALRQ